MSRYIKTIYGVYDTTKGINDNKLKDYFISAKVIPYSDVIKESDNLEDLFDEFIAHWKKDDKEFGTNGTYWKDNNEKPRYFQYNNLDVICSEISYFASSLDRLDIYGALWTEKGLIYVAKLDKNNGWELI